MIISYKNREIDYSKKVRIYRNLNKRGKVFSVKQNELVVAHIVDSSFLMFDCSFIINEKSRWRAIIKKTRNVHAFIEGFLRPITSNVVRMADYDDVVYDHNKCGYFERFDGENYSKLHKASVVYFYHDPPFISSLLVEK